MTTATHPDDTFLAADPIASAELLTAAVRVVTGSPSASPRDGQGRLEAAISSAMSSRGVHVAIAPTGSGKSLATLSPAFAAAVAGERTVISTDSLALMSQLQSKDVPTMQAAMSAAFPDSPEVRVAFVKGTANYVDPAQTVATAQAHLGVQHSNFGRLAKALDGAGPATGEDAALRELLRWAIGQYLDDEASGERQSCPIDVSDEHWAQVSSSSAEADDGTRFGVTSKAQLAKDRAAEAHIIVTNHSILAVQAARGIPVAVGSRRLGVIDHLIVDEAHTLPTHVRNQGARRISRLTLLGAARTAYRAAGSPSGRMKAWNDEADHLGDDLDSILGTLVGRQAVHRLDQNADPLAAVSERLKDWAERGRKFLEPVVGGGDVGKSIKAAAASDRLSGITDAVDAVGRHRSGWARWAEREHVRGKDPILSAQVAPVNVGFLLRDNLWNCQEGEDGEPHRMTVITVSATLPDNYPFQAGLDTQIAAYPTPFSDAYTESMLFIPKVGTPDELARIGTQQGGKWRFNPEAHPAWAGAMIVQLVRANGGSALILAAKSDDGRLYAEMLRRQIPGLTVHTQWDGGDVVGAWRSDVGSVLVGTKSYATGLDRPGPGCSLVVIDRIPRSPGNPMDDARVAEIQERTGDRWGADRAVYATDASLLLSQAAGRLIRTESDRGAVCVLDPRLLKGSALTYPAATREKYMKPLAQFGRKTATLADAVAWLEGRREAS